MVVQFRIWAWIESLDLRLSPFTERAQTEHPCPTLASFTLDLLPLSSVIRELDSLPEPTLPPPQVDPYLSFHLLWGKTPKLHLRVFIT